MKPYFRISRDFLRDAWLCRKVSRLLRLMPAHLRGREDSTTSQVETDRKIENSSISNYGVKENKDQMETYSGAGR